MGVKVSTAPDLKSKTIVNDEGKYEALVFVKLGDYEKTYDILLDGKVVPAINQSLLASNKTAPTGHTYESGTASAGTHADTEIIAEDLETVLSAYLSSDKRISEALLTADQVGNTIAEEPSYLKGRYVNVRYEFAIDQYATNAHIDQIGFGAKGVVVFKNGGVQSRLTHHGTGYDNGLITIL